MLPAGAYEGAPASPVQCRSRPLLAALDARTAEVVSAARREAAVGSCAAADPGVRA